MAINKYTGDYRIVEEFDSKGKVKTHTEYIGEYYCFEGEKGKLGSKGVYSVVYMFLCTAAYIISLIPSTFAMRSLSTSLIYAFEVIPLFLMTKEGIKAVYGQMPMERRVAEGIENRIVPSSLFSIVLSAGAIISDIICALMAGYSRDIYDYLFLISAALIFIMSVMIFNNRKYFKTIKSSSNNK
ncbi:hypothetical protein [Butyrivibrio sp. MC2013]|uniref:hypothetical protein n=1 Tax=Butyrivibrio sp. MC2013 TaxID=1280686 RepID=UPI00047E2774|nr:hypothetical protein [Butyrivibrio sp. MC2013]